ncbi:MAG: LysE family transporter [Bacillota bacterium]|nr:LysE family transporter [Bacillota bacterium]
MKRPASARLRGGGAPWGRRPWIRVFATAFVVGFSGALSPGPLTVATIHEAARIGWVAGPLATLTHGLLELLMVAALGLGLSRVLRRGAVAGTIALAGGLVLVWMGWTMIAGAPAAVLPGLGCGPEEGSSYALGGPLLAGILATLGNPYWFLWWATVGASQLAWSRERTPGGPLTFWAGHVMADLVWLAALAAAVATGRRLLTDAIYRGLLYLLGAAMVLLGVYFAASAARLYRGPAGSGRQSAGPGGIAGTGRE